MSQGFRAYGRFPKPLRKASYSGRVCILFCIPIDLNESRSKAAAQRELCPTKSSIAKRASLLQMNINVYFLLEGVWGRGFLF